MLRNFQPENKENNIIFENPLTNKLVKSLIKSELIKIE